jgi:hypothetical protein
MSRLSRFIAFALVAWLLAISGCEQKEERPGAQQPPAAAEKQTLRVVVPDEVRGRWQAVKIAVMDKESQTEEVHTVDITSTFTVADSDMTLEVKNFLPAFIMDGSMMTSASNETKNPAVQVVISEKGEEVYRGWLFSRYPGTHSFQHPQYSFTLVDFVPVPEKKVDNKARLGQDTRLNARH